MMTKEEFLKKFTRVDGKFNSAAIRHISQEDLEFLIAATPQFLDEEPTIQTRLYVLKNNVESVSCPVCHKIQLKLNDKGTIGEPCKKCFDSTPALKRKSMEGRDYAGAKKKRAQTMLEKYGVEFNSQREDIHHVWTQSKLAKSDTVEALSKLLDRDYLVEKHQVQRLSASAIAKELGVYYGTVVDYLRHHGIEFMLYRNNSVPEQAVEALLKSLSVEYDRNSRSIISPKELDFYIPSKQIAIEVNGLYWHSEINGSKPSSYHLGKLK
jgi:hypothetical protein